MSFQDLFPSPDLALNVRVLKGPVFNVTGYAASVWSTIDLGPIASSSGPFTSLVRAQTAWLHPRSGSRWSEWHSDYNGVVAIAKLQNGHHLVVLGVAGADTKCTTYVNFGGDSGLQLVTRNDSGQDQPHGAQALVAVGDLDETMQLLSGVVADINSNVSAVSAVPAVQAPTTGTSIASTDQWYDGLLYCTWNGLGPNLTHTRIIDAIQDLDSSGVRIAGIIIDDGWQDTNDARQVSTFEAKVQTFPTGLKGLVDDIRTKYPYIQHIGVWSALTLYWNGLAHGSPLDKKYQTVDCTMQTYSSRVVAASDIARFYDDYFSFLASCGVTCVKIDDQCALDDIVDDQSTERGRLWQPYQDALRTSATKYFGHRIIYCMAMIPNVMQYTLTQQSQQSQQSQQPLAVFRNSDDFFPNVPSSHYWHVYCNFMNSLYTRHLQGALPDYDMFQTKMGDARLFPSLHAAARCLSGGPIYFTDSPQQHDLPLIRMLSARAPSGVDVVLRPDSVGRPLDPYAPFPAQSLFKVINNVGTSKLLGLFNISDNTMTAVVHAEDFSLDPASTYIVRSFIFRSIFALGNLVTLPSAGWDVLTAVTLLNTLSNGRLGVFGLVDKIAGAAAVTSLSVSGTEAMTHLEVSLKAYGTLGVYYQGSLSHVVSTLNGSPVDVYVRGLGNQEHLIEIKVSSGHQIEVALDLTV